MPVCVDKDDDGTADTLYFVAANSNGLVNTGNSARTITVSYSFKDNNNGDVLTFSNTWSVAEMENEETYNEQFSYSDLCKGDYESLGTPTKSSGSGGFPCVTPDTLITLADGTQKEIQYVNYSDEILVWDFVNGKYTKASASIVMNHGYGNYTVVTLKFDDGTVINTINGHGFFDTETNEYVVISEDNVANYVGHEFVKLDSNGYAYTKLVDYEISSQYTESWSVLTSVYYNCILEGMWTLTPAEVEDSPKYLMPFEINDDMKYDIEKMNADIETYGLYTYEEFADCLTEEQFNALGIATFKVAVAKGYITYEEIMYLINLHMN